MNNLKQITTLRIITPLLILFIFIYLATPTFNIETDPSSLTSLIQDANTKNNTFYEGLPIKKIQNDTEHFTKIQNKIKKITNCYDKPLQPRIQQRGKYWVLYNYIRAERSFTCAESITYTTHGDFTFLDNVEPLVEKWNGPVSLALYAPGDDFDATVQSIEYLKNCASSDLVRELVTFHIYFNAEYMPKKIPKLQSLYEYDCSSIEAPYLTIESNQTYKNINNMSYPVNVGRNVARETAQTYFILPSDIELYPSSDLIDKFLVMVAKRTELLTQNGNPKVFPLHLFEVQETSDMPNSKTELKEMLNKGTAIPFHKFVCSYCHSIPKAQEWTGAEETDGLHVFNVGKRRGDFKNWEPIFIGTNAEPFYDERLTWDGRRDKMTQGYALCALDYEFLVLDNAFLVHKPGIKYYNKEEDTRRYQLAQETNMLIDKVIYPELKIVYGEKEGCTV